MTDLWALMQDNRNFAWSFANLVSMMGTGLTIEWRMPPGVTTADQCFGWVELCIGFLQAARQPDTEPVLRSGAYLACPGDLKRFIEERGRLPGSSPSYLDSAFTNTGWE